MMKRFLTILLLALTLISAVQAASIRYTNYGGGLTPNTFLGGTTAISISGTDYRTQYYQDSTRRFVSGTDYRSGQSFFAAQQRPIRTGYTGRNADGYLGRTMSYGDWTTTNVRARGDNWGVAVARNPRGTYSGTSYIGSRRVGGTPRAHSRPGYGSYARSNLLNRYNPYDRGYNTPRYARSNFPTTPSASISRGRVYY